MSTTPIAERKSARVALFALDKATAELFAECFRQFGISSLVVSAQESDRLMNEKFDACVVRLDEHAEPALKLVRGSRVNYRMVLYGITTELSLRFSHYGINAVLYEPLDRRTVLKAVHATRTLVLHEFRRYVRIPLVTEVTMDDEGRRIAAKSKEISGGGMSLTVPKKLRIGSIVSVDFTLPNAPRVKLYATVRWETESGVVGIQFNDDQPAQAHVKDWINSYLEL